MRAWHGSRQKRLRSRIGESKLCESLFGSAFHMVERGISAREGAARIADCSPVGTKQHSLQPTQVIMTPTKSDNLCKTSVLIAAARTYREYHVAPISNFCTNIFWESRSDLHQFFKREEGSLEAYLGRCI